MSAVRHPHGTSWGGVPPSVVYQGPRQSSLVDAVISGDQREVRSLIALIAQAPARVSKISPRTGSIRGDGREIGRTHDKEENRGISNPNDEKRAASPTCQMPHVRVRNLSRLQEKQGKIRAAANQGRAAFLFRGPCTPPRGDVPWARVSRTPASWMTLAMACCFSFAATVE
jgi:hypothetical protein